MAHLGLKVSTGLTCAPGASLHVFSPADSQACLHSGGKVPDSCFQAMFAQVPLTKSKSYSQAQIQEVQKQTPPLDGKKLQSIYGFFFLGSSQSLIRTQAII